MADEAFPGAGSDGPTVLAFNTGALPLLRAPVLVSRWEHLVPTAEEKITVAAKLDLGTRNRIRLGIYAFGVYSSRLNFSRV